MLVKIPLQKNNHILVTEFGGIFDEAFNGCKAQARKPPRRRHFDPAKVQIQLPTLEVYVPQVWTLKNFGEI